MRRRRRRKQHVSATGRKEQTVCANERLFSSVDSRDFALVRRRRRRRRREDLPASSGLTAAVFLPCFLFSLSLSFPGVQTRRAANLHLALFIDPVLLLPRVSSSAARAVKERKLWYQSQDSASAQTTTRSPADKSLTGTSIVCLLIVRLTLACSLSSHPISSLFFIVSSSATQIQRKIQQIYPQKLMSTRDEDSA